ncbi:MAG: hypothetical protein PVI66_07695 [Candidatus Aminicenantes bacterium]|jgi:hypothetical protein
MKKLCFILAIVLMITPSFSNTGSRSLSSESTAAANSLNEKTQKIIFAGFAEGTEQLSHMLIFVESIRKFAGSFHNAPVWIYIPESSKEKHKNILEKFALLQADIYESTAPKEALEYYFARKVFAAAEAETKAKSQCKILAWLDEDTIILKEPQDFLLPKEKSLGYRPVMHQNIGSLYSEAPDEFWSRVYKNLSIPESALFPMVTPADQRTLRPYFNAGLMVVRPERGVLRKWPENFKKLYDDPVFAEMCQKDVHKRIFLHQAALVGAILNTLKKEEMLEFSPKYNYPLFFHEKFEATRTFGDISEAVTTRYDIYFRNPSPGWSERLKGPTEIIAWLKEKFPEKTGEK